MLSETNQTDVGNSEPKIQKANFKICNLPINKDINDKKIYKAKFHVKECFHITILVDNINDS